MNYWKEKVAPVLVSSVLALTGFHQALASVTVIGASGGSTISADTAANAVSPAWTTLGAITITEGLSGDFAVGTNVTLVLKAPAGFQFNTAITPSASFTAGRNIMSASAAVSDSGTITITLTVTNTTAIDMLVIGSTTAIMVRPNAGTPLASGRHIYAPSSGGGNSTIGGITTSGDGSSGSNFGALSEVAGNAGKLAFTISPAGATAGAAFGTQPVIKTADQFGNISTTGLPGTLFVTLALTSGTGPLQGTVSRSIGTGVATYSGLRIDVAGTDKQLTVTTTNGYASGVSSIFTVNPAAASKLVIAVEPSPTATAGVPFVQQPVILVEDAFNNVRSNDVLIVTASRLGGAGTLSGSTSMATAGGAATFADLAHPLATNITLNFSSGSLTPAVSANIAVSPGPLSQLQVLLPGETAAPGTVLGKAGAPLPQTAGTVFLLKVNAVDSNWNVLANITHLITFSSSDTNSVLPASAVLVNGTSSVSISFNTIGARTVSAKDTVDVTTTGTSATFTVNAGTFVKLQLLAPGEEAAPGTVSGKTGTPAAQTAGTAFSVIINAVDANWNVVTSATGSGFRTHVASSDPNAALPANAVLVAGTRTASLTFRTAGSATVTASDTSDSTKDPSSSPSITVNAGAFAKLQLLAPGETAAPGTATGKTGAPLVQNTDTPVTVNVNAVDGNWNAVTTASDSVAITSSDPNASLPPSAVLSAGSINFSVKFNTAGTRSITASDSSDGSKTADTSAAIPVSSGAFAKLQVLMPGETAASGTVSGKAGIPSAQTAGIAFSLNVRAVDASWNLVSTNDTVGITASESGAVLPPNAALTNGSGPFSVILKRAGDNTVTASDLTHPAIASGTGTLTHVIPGSFAKLQLLLPGETAAPGSSAGKSGTSASQSAGAEFQVTVHAVDANWNLIRTNDTVHLTSSDPRAVLPANAPVTNGIRTFSVALKTVGIETLTASDVTHLGIGADTSSPATINAGAASKLVISVQPSAIATTDVVFAQQPVIRVEDQFGNLRSAANGNPDNTTIVTAARNLGVGTLHGTVTVTAVDGLAIFSNLSYDAAEKIHIGFSSGTLAGAISSNITVIAANTAPTIQDILDLSVYVDQPTTIIPLRAFDAESTVADLQFSGVSSNLTLVPAENIFFGTLGTNRYMTVTPAFGLTGTAGIRVTVSDGTNTASDSFVLTVNPPPAGAARFANPSSITIPDAGSGTPFPSTIDVTGMSGTVTNVTLTLSKFAHHYPADVRMLLVGPSAQGMIIFSHCGGGYAATNVTIALSDGAAFPLPNEFQLISEPLRPAAYSTNTFFPAPAPPGPYGPLAFSTFNGLPANGVWSLYVYDAEPPDNGMILGGWSLMIATTGGGNLAPTLSDIPDQSTFVNTPATIPFTINDVDTAADYLEVTATSSNPTLAPDGNIILGGSGSSRMVTVTPSSDQTGTAMITVTVSDGVAYAQDTFVLTVRVNLKISSISVLANGQKTIAGVGEPGKTYEIQHSVDLVSWQTIASVTADASGAFQFETNDPVPYDARFFRVKLPETTGTSL